MHRSNLGKSGSGLLGNSSMNRGAESNNSASMNGGPLDASGAGAGGSENSYSTMIHPSTKTAFRSQFAQYETDGFITAEALHTIMGNMTEIRDVEGDYHQPGLILAAAAGRLRSDKKLSHNECLKKLGKAIKQERKKMEEYHQEDTSARTVQVRWLGTRAYLSYLFSCTKAPANVVNRWQGLSSVNPKLSLLLIVVLMSLVLAISIVALLTIVNLSAVQFLAEESQDVDLLAFSELTQQLIPKVRSSYVEQVKAAAVNLATPVEFALDDLAHGLNSLQSFSASQLAMMIEHSSRRIDQEIRDSLQSDLDNLYQTATQLDSSTQGLATLLDNWYMQLRGNGTQGTFAVMVELNSLWTTPLYQPSQWASGSCPSCALQLQCITDLSSSSTLTGVGINGMEDISLVDNTSVPHWTSAGNATNLGLTYSLKISTSVGICLIQSLHSRNWRVTQKAQNLLQDVLQDTQGFFTETLASGGQGIGTPVEEIVPTSDEVEAVMLLQGFSEPVPLTNESFRSLTSNLTVEPPAGVIRSSFVSPIMMKAIERVGQSSGTRRVRNMTGLLDRQQGFNGAVRTGAYSAFSISSDQVIFIVLVSKSREFFCDHLARRLPKTLSVGDAGPDGALTVSVAANLDGLPVVLGEDRLRSSDASPYVTLGLGGYSGAMLAYSADFEEIIAGYASVAKYNSAIIMEMKLTVAEAAVIPILERAVQTANSRYRSGREISLIGRSEVDGSLIYLAPASLRGQYPPAVAVQCFASPESATVGIQMDDRSTARCVYFKNPNVVVIAHRDSQVVTNKLLTYAGYGLIVGCGCAIISLIITRLLTRNVLDHIERDYVEYKMQIEAEKRQFSELVKDVMPQYISERIMNGEKLIVDNYPQLTFMFSDIIGFTDRTRQMSTVEMVRLLGYTFMMEDGVAEYFGIHKIKTIGDGYFCVAGLEDSGSAAVVVGRDRNSSEEDTKDEHKGDHESDRDEEEHKEEDRGRNAMGRNKSPHTGDQIFRMVSFAATVQQLLSGSFVHFPEKTECFHQSAGSDLGQIKLLRMKMGIHSGPAIAGVVDVGRAPHFDCFGPSVNIASRMETTAPLDRVQLSGVTHTLLNNKSDNQGVFEFEAPKKTLVKGYGTMTTHILKATTLQVPDEIIERLHIDRAVKRQYFGEGGLLGDDVDHAGTASNQTQSDMHDSGSDSRMSGSSKSEAGRPTPPQAKKETESAFAAPAPPPQIAAAPMVMPSSAAPAPLPPLGATTVGGALPTFEPLGLAPPPNGALPALGALPSFGGLMPPPQ